MNQCCKGGKWFTMVMMFVGGVHLCLTELPYYSYRRKPTGQEIFCSPLEPIGIILFNVCPLLIE